MCQHWEAGIGTIIFHSHSALNRQDKVVFYTYNSETEDQDLYVAGDLYDNHVVTPAIIVVPRRREKPRSQNKKDEKSNWANNVMNEEPMSRPTPTELQEWHLLNPINNGMLPQNPLLGLRHLLLVVVHKGVVMFLKQLKAIPYTYETCHLMQQLNFLMRFF